MNDELTSHIKLFTCIGIVIHLLAHSFDKLNWPLFSLGGLLNWAENFLKHGSITS